RAREAPVTSRPTTTTVADPALAWIDRWFIPMAIGILLVAAAIRLPELGLNPFHHDEGVNGWFPTNLVRTGHSLYEPHTYPLRHPPHSHPPGLHSPPPASDIRSA